MFVVAIDENQNHSVFCCNKTQREEAVNAKAQANGWLYEEKTKAEVLGEYGTEANIQASAPDIWAVYTRAGEGDKIVKVVLPEIERFFLSSDTDGLFFTREAWAEMVLRAGNLHYDVFGCRDHALVHYRGLPESYKQDPKISAILESIKNHAG